MSKKILIAVTVLVIALAVYVGITVSQNSKTAFDGDTESTMEQSYVSGENVYSQKNKNDINSFVIENLNDTENPVTLEFTRTADGSFIINGYEGIDYNEGVIDSLMEHAVSLYYTGIIETYDSLEEYGLDNPAIKAVAKYNDGTQTTVFIGDRSQDREYNYVMFDDKKDIYISSINNYLMYVYELSDFIYKYIPPITKESLMYMDVIQRGGEEIEIAYMDEKTGNAADLAAYGMQTLTMIQPLEGTAVYPTNLQDTVLSSLSLLTLDKVYKINPTENDLAQCGLDEPFLTIALIDGNSNMVNLNIGDKADEGSYYCTTPLYPHIFTIKETAVENFIDINVLDFTEKFVQLINRKLVTSIDIIENGNIKYEVKFEGTDQSTPDNQRDTRTTTINGTVIDYENFGKFYQIFAGITFDSFAKNVQLSGIPEVEFVIHLTDGTSKSMKYFTSDDDINFYVVQEDSLDSYKLVSKRSVREVFTKAAALTE